MENANQEARGMPSATPPSPPAPVLMMVFWLLLGSAAGIKISQSLWQFLGWSDGEVSVAVPVGGSLGRSPPHSCASSVTRVC